MTNPVKLNLKVTQGASFKQVLRWESSTKVYKPISNISQAAPLVVEAPAHEVPVGWRVKFTNILGMKELNSSDTYHVVTDASTNTLTINALNSIGYTAYVSGGIVEYNKPVTLTGFTGRMQIRTKVESPDVILELTSANQGILIDTTNKNIAICISPAQSSAIEPGSYVYSLELESPSGEVTAFSVGSLTIVREVTR